MVDRISKYIRSSVSSRHQISEKRLRVEYGGMYVCKSLDIDKITIIIFYISLLLFII